MHLPAPTGLGASISKALSTWALAIPAGVEQGDIALQGGLNGGDGSCGIAALNYIQRALDMDVLKWGGGRAEYFRNILLLSLVKYHCAAAEREGEGFFDWVAPVSKEVEKALAEVEEGVGEDFEQTGYRDFNLYTPLDSHPIFTFLDLPPGVHWLNEDRRSPTPPARQPSVSPLPLPSPPVQPSPFTRLSAHILHQPTTLNGLSLPPIQALLHKTTLPTVKRERSDSLNLQSTPSNPTKRPWAPKTHDVKPIVKVEKDEASDSSRDDDTFDSDGRRDIVDSYDDPQLNSDSDSEVEIVKVSSHPFHPPRPPRTPPPRRSLVIDLTQTPPSGTHVINLVTPERKVKAEKISPKVKLERGGARSQGPTRVKVEDVDPVGAVGVKVEKVEPGIKGTVVVKVETKRPLLPCWHDATPSSVGPNPRVTPAPPSPRLNQLYGQLSDAVSAVFTRERLLGHIWRRGQSRASSDGRTKKLTLRCNHYSTHTPTHRRDIDPSDWRHGKSARTNCMAHVNINLVRETGEYRVTHIDWTHNHKPEIPEGGSARKKPTAEQKQLITELATNPSQTFSRSQISEVLKRSGESLEPRQIGNLMNQSRREAQKATDSLGGEIPAILANLEQKNLDDPGWFFRMRMTTSGVVDGVFFQTPQQVALAQRYGDVLIVDACYGRNNAGYVLTIGIVVDGHCASRNVFYTLHATEDAETVRWLLRAYLDSTGFPPTTFMSDRHATYIAVIPSSLPFTDHLYCIHHLLSNVDQNLRSKIGTENWPAFSEAFFTAFHAVSPDDFESKWKTLIDNYPTAAPYLNSQLYSCREKWAFAWVSYKFTCGVRTSGRVESENRVTKSFAGTKKSLFQLFLSLIERTNGQLVQEMMKIRDSSRRQHPGQLEILFSGALRLIRDYAAPYTVQECFRQMNASLFFMTEVLQLPEGTRSWNEYAVTVTSEPGFTWSDGEQNHMINSYTNEDAYVGLQWLLRLILGRGHRVLHLLRVVHRGTNKAHMLAILEGGNYVCDCAMGMNLGIPCRHFFQVLTSVRDLRFHLGLIRRRWLQNPNLDVTSAPTVLANEAPVAAARRAQELAPVSAPHASTANAARHAQELAPAAPSASTTNATSSGLLVADNHNPLHPHVNRTDAPPPPTQTLPSREIYHETQAALRPLVNSVHTQEELEGLLEGLQRIRQQQEATQRREAILDPPTQNLKGRPRTQRLTGPTEPGPARGGGGAGAAPPGLRRCTVCRQHGHNRTKCPDLPR